eukprot:m51a1_g8342 hypothetical protein (429) ;mRNA; f:18901-20688
MEPPQPSYTLRGHSAAVSSVRFSPDGQGLFSGASDGELVGWDLATRRPRVRWMAHDKFSVLALHFLPDGRLLSQGRDGMAKLWDLADGGEPRCSAVIPTRCSAFTRCCLAAAGSLLACTAEDASQVHLWDALGRSGSAPVRSLGHDAARGMCLHLADAPAASSVCAAFEDGHAHLLDLGGSPSPQGRDGMAKLWDLADGGEPRCSAVIPTRCSAFTRCCLAAAGSLLACTAEDASRVHLWDALGRSGSAPVRSLGHDAARGMCLHLADAPAASSVCAAFEDGHAHLLDLGGSPSPSLSAPVSSEAAICVCVSGSRLAGGSADGRLVFADFDASRQTTEQVAEFSAKAEGAPSVGVADACVRSDGKVAATGGWDRRVRVWAWRRPRPLAVLRFHTAGVSAVDWAPHVEGSPGLLASASQDKRIALWNIF